MKYNNSIKILLAAIICFSMGCKKFLDYKPQGALNPSDLTTPSAAEGLATAAYAGIANDEILQVSNTMPNDELWEKIADDFQAAIDSLPLTQPGEPGRANQLSAKAYLAKVRLYQAYVQDNDYNVVSIDQAKLQEVVSLTNDVINSGLYALNPDFAYNFLDGHDN